MRILLVEDSQALRLALTKGLTASGFVVDAVADGQQGWVYASRNDYDVMVLDLMLPTLDGLSLLRRLRAAGVSVHVLVRTAKGGRRRYARKETVLRVDRFALDTIRQEVPGSNAAESAMSVLRAELRAVGAPDLISTRRGHGYVLEGPES